MFYRKRNKFKRLVLFRLKNPFVITSWITPKIT